MQIFFYFKILVKLDIKTIKKYALEKSNSKAKLIQRLENNMP